MYIVLFLQAEGHCRTDVRGGCGYYGLKLAGLGYPLALVVVVVAQRLAVDGEGHLTSLAWLQLDLVEALQLLLWSGQSRLHIVNIELHDLSTRATTCIGYRHRNSQLAIGLQHGAINRSLSIAERGIAQPVTEGEERLDTLGIVPTITH